MPELEPINGLRVFKYEVKPMSSNDALNMAVHSNFAAYARTLEVWDQSNLKRYRASTMLGTSVTMSIPSESSSNSTPAEFTPTDCDALCSRVTGIMSARALSSLGYKPEILENPVGSNAQVVHPLELFPTILRPHVFKMNGGNRVLVETWPTITLAGQPEDFERVGINPIEPTLDQMGLYIELTRSDLV